MFDQLLLFSRYQQFPATQSRELMKFRHLELGNLSNFQEMPRVMSSLVKSSSIEFLYQHSSPKLCPYQFSETVRCKYRRTFEPSQTSTICQCCATTSKLYYLMLHYFHISLFNVRLFEVALFDVTLFNVALFNVAISETALF